jgi:predicted phosphohydrolase
MTIQYCSDLHLEFAINSQYLMANPIVPVGDILILAGDITYWGQKHFKHPFFDYISKNFKSAYYIPGNHEFYTGKDVRILDNPVFEPIRDNVFITNNHTVNIDSTDIFFTTLWSQISHKHSLIIESSVSDFRLIKYKGKPLKTETFNKLHNDSLAYLQNAVKDSRAVNKVIVSHHVPSLLCNPEKYKDSQINSAFVTDLDEIIRELNADYWIYGHHHANMPEITIGKTKLVTNQLGYLDQNENTGYERAKTMHPLPLL